MSQQVCKTMRLGLALCAVLALAGCSSSVKRSAEHKSPAFKLSAEFPVGTINVSATPEALANIEAAGKKFDPSRLKEANPVLLTSTYSARPERPEHGCSGDASPGALLVERSVVGLHGGQ